MTADVESLEGLERAADYEVEVELTGEDGKIEMVMCRKLGFGAVAQATAFVKKQRRKECWQDAVDMNLEMETVRRTHEGAIARITCTTVSIYDVLNDGAGQIKLFQLALNKARGTKAPLTYEQTADRLAHTDIAAQFRKLCILSGVYVLNAKETKPPDPSRTSEASTTDAVQPSDP